MQIYVTCTYQIPPINLQPNLSQFFLSFYMTDLRWYFHINSSKFLKLHSTIQLLKIQKPDMLYIAPIREKEQSILAHPAKNMRKHFLKKQYRK